MNISYVPCRVDPTPSFLRPESPLSELKSGVEMVDNRRYRTPCSQWKSHRVKGEDILFPVTLFLSHCRSHTLTWVVSRTVCQLSESHFQSLGKGSVPTLTQELNGYSQSEIHRSRRLIPETPVYMFTHLTSSRRYRLVETLTPRNDPSTVSSSGDETVL